MPEDLPRFEHDGPSDGDLMMARLEQERTNANNEEWFFQYGFAHECSCSDDLEAGNTTDVPECYLGMVDEALKSLQTARAALYTVATASTNDAYSLKALAHEFFFKSGE